VQQGEQPRLDELLRVRAAADQHTPAPAAPDQYSRSADGCADQDADTNAKPDAHTNGYADRRAAGGQPHPAVRIARAVWA